MKKQMMAAMGALAVLAACSETSEELIPEVKGEGVYATIEQPVSVDTRSLAYENNKLVFTWAEGEKVVVFGNKDAASFNSLTSGEKSTKLESEGFTLNDDVDYYACLPAYTIPAATQSTSVPVTLLDQRQTANDNSEHLKSFDYACASATKAESENSISFELKNQVAWIVLDHTFSEATDNVTSITISADEDLFVTEGTLDVTTSTITGTAQDSKITLALGEKDGDGLSFAAGETFRGFFTLNPVDLSGKKLTFSATTKDGETITLGTFTKASANITKNLAVRIQTSGSAKVATVDGKEYSTLKAAMEAASDGATISVVSDVTMETLSIDKNVTIDLGGNTITSSSRPFVISEDGVEFNLKNGSVVANGGNNWGVVLSANAGKVVLTDCNITAQEGAIGLLAGTTGNTIEINSGVYTGLDNAVISGNGSARDGEPNNIIINGGTFNGKIQTTGYVACGIYAPWKDIITINGGEFNIENGVGVLCRGGQVYINGGTFTTTDPNGELGKVGDSRVVVPCKTLCVDKNSNYSDSENARIIVSGGRFSDDACKDYLADGYVTSQVYDETKNIWTEVVEATVEYDGVKYGSLQAAISASEDDSKEITILKDMEVSQLQLFSENRATINLNGKNVTTTSNTGVLFDGGHLTIKGSGTFGDPSQKTTSYLFNMKAYSVLNIEGDATFYSALDCVYLENETTLGYVDLNIKGGKWIGGEQNGVYWTINKYDKAAGDINISVTGGEFYKYNPAESHTENPVANFVADGYGVIKDGDWYKVVTEAEVIENNTVNIENQLKTSTAVVSNDVEVSCVSAAKNSTLQLENGATITGYGQDSGLARDVIMTSNGLDIKGKGKIVSKYANDTEKSKSTAIRVGGGTVNIYDGIEVDGGSGCHGNYAVRMVAGTVNIFGGYFHSSPINDTESSEVIYLEPRTKTTVINLNIEGGVFESSGDASFLINCLDAYVKNCHIKITGGTFVGFNPADSAADKIDGKNANWVPDGYVSKEVTYNGKQAWEVTKKTTTE